MPAVLSRTYLCGPGRLDQETRSLATALVNRDHAARHAVTEGSFGFLKSRMTIEYPFWAISTQLLPDASENDDLTHFNSNKLASS